MKTWIVPVAAALGTVAAGMMGHKGWTGAIVGALAGVAAGLVAGYAIDRYAAPSSGAAPAGGDRMEP